MAQQVDQVLKLGVDSDDLIFQQFDGNEVIRVDDDEDYISLIKVANILLVMAQI